MRYELFARSRETKVFEFQDSFTDEKERYYRIDTVDTDLYDEAIILITEFRQEPKLDLYINLDKKPKQNKEEISNESIRGYKK